MIKYTTYNNQGGKVIMNKMTKFYSSVQNIVLTLFLLVQFFLLPIIIWQNKNDFGAYTYFYTFIAIIFLVLFTALIMPAIIPKVSIFLDQMTKKTELIILGSSLIFLFILPIISFLVTKPGTSADMANIYGSASQLINNPSLIGQDFQKATNSEMFQHYYARCPNNIPIFLIFYGLFKLGSIFNINNFHLILVITNSLLVTLAFFFTYKITRQLFGRKYGFFSLLFILLFPYIYIGYGSYVYTDTLSMFFPITSLYFFLKAFNTKKYIPYFIISGVLIAIGTQIKFTVLILLIAFMINILFNTSLTSKKKMLCTLTLVVTFSSVYVIENQAKDSTDFFNFSIKDNDHAQGTAHYFAMGAQRNGRWSNDSEKFTRQFETTAEKDQANWALYRKIVSEEGINNYFSFLVNKLNVTWGDGSFRGGLEFNYGINTERNTFYDTMQGTPNQNSIFAQLFDLDGRFFKITYNLQQIVWFILFGLTILNTLYELKHNDKSTGKTTVISIYSLIGLTLLLLFWETNARYTVNFFPLTILCGVGGLRYFSRLSTQLNSLITGK